MRQYSSNTSLISSGRSAIFQYFVIVINILACFYTYYAMDFDSSGYTSMFASGILVSVVLAINLCFHSLRGRIVTAIFLFFTCQPVVSVFWNIVVMGGVPVWRDLFPSSVIIYAIGSTLFYTSALCLLISLNFLGPGSIPPKTRYKYPYDLFLAVFITSISFWIIGIALTTSRLDQVASSDDGGRAGFLLVTCIVGISPAIGLLFNSKALKYILILTLVVGLLLALSGFRMSLVFAGLSAFTAFSLRWKISFKRLIILLALVIGAYYAMASLEALRKSNVNLSDVISGRVSVDSGQVAAASGRAEQLELFSVYYASSRAPEMGMTYADSVVRILPNAIHKRLYDAKRPQDLLVEGAPYGFRKSGLNLGAHFFAESILNFGFWGPIIVGTFVSLFFMLIEKHKGRSITLQAFYCVMGMMMPTLAIYGSTNFIKMSLTSFAFMISVLLINRFPAFVRARF
jgi:hypothetical protein